MTIRKSKNSLEKFLSGGDLRSIGKNRDAISKIDSQENFNALFDYLFHEDRLIVMRAADAIEKITLANPEYLVNHRKEVFELCAVSENKELKWHLAQLIPRLNLKAKEFDKAWSMLTNWAKDKSNSRIVRVNSIQALFELCRKKSTSKKELMSIFNDLVKEGLPSLTARIKKLKKSMADKSGEQF